MSNRRNFVIERKSFSVSCARDWVEIGDKSRSLQVSVGLEVGLVKWLIQKLKSQG